MSKKTVEEICVCRTQGDLWNELNSKQSLNSIILHIFPPNVNYVMRFVGPFVKAKRIYTGGLKTFINQMDIKGIVNGDKEAFEKAQQLITHHFGPEKTDVAKIFPNNTRRNQEDYLIFREINKDPRKEAISQLAKMFGRDKCWQNCILVNAMCENYYPGASRNPLSATIKVVALAPTICESIALATSVAGGERCRINGFFAHSIEMSKTGYGIQSKYNISLLPEDNLCQAHINKIMFEGLYDIPTIAKACNKKRYPFIYKVEPDYKMTDKFMASVLEEHKKFEENKHIHNTDDHINEIPEEAFEKRNNMRNGIDSLEV